MTDRPPIPELLRESKVIAIGRNVPPDRAPDHSVTYRTSPDQALVYRLSGDRNPLHADPATARAAGFPRPILHGLCTYGIACHAILQTICDYDPVLIAGLDVEVGGELGAARGVFTDRPNAELVRGLDLPGA